MMRLVACMMILTTTSTATEPTPLPTIDLGTAGGFALLTKDGVSATGVTSVTGNMGTSPSGATGLTGFDLTLDGSTEFSTSTLVNGKVYAASYAVPTPAMMTTAISDMETAYADAAGRVGPDTTELGAGNIEGMSLTGGLHKWSSGVTFSASLYFDAGSNPDTVWILQIAQDLVLATGAQVMLWNGAKASNIFWQVAGQAQILAGAHVEGIILCKTAIIFGSGGSLNGRGLAQTAVTMIATTIVAPQPAATTNTTATTTTTAAELGDNPVYTAGLTARRSALRCFEASFENYVPPGLGYERTVYNNGTHDLCPYLFSKTLEHDPVTSFPLCSHVSKIIEAVSGIPVAESFQAIQQAPGCQRKLEGPQTGRDSMLMSSPATSRATAEKVTDPLFGFEIAEVFAMALLRDKPFRSWHTDQQVLQVMQILNTYSHMSSAPLEGGVITIHTLMRGAGVDETKGPYVSQYLLQPFNYGSVEFTQKYVMEIDPHEDTEWEEFIKVQDGQLTNEVAKDGESFNFSPRNLGGNVHNDPLFQFYYNAALISFQCGISPTGMKGTGSSDTPPSTITAWTQGGGPDVLGAVSGVALSALKAAWWHKWQQAMRIRPEAVGGLFEFCKNNQAECEQVPELRPMYDAFRQGLKDMTLASAGGTLLLQMQYPEGSPTHPSWPAGHATVAGACVTVLKAMLNTHRANNEKLLWPTDGTCTPLEALSKETMTNYTGVDMGDMTIIGELNKLASNAALGRNFAGVHFRSDGDQGLAIGEQIAIQYLTSKLKEYSLKSVLNSFTLEKFDGTFIEITAEEGNLL